VLVAATVKAISHSDGATREGDRAPDGAAVGEWGLAAIMLTGCVCVATQAAMTRGQVPPLMGGVEGYVPPSVLLAYLLVPLAVLGVMGRNPFSYFGLGRWRSIVSVFVILLVVVLAGAFWVSSLGSVRGYYARGGPVDGRFVLKTLLTLACLEYFFRGFMLLPLAERFGWHASLISLLPYVLMHVGKPLIELYGSVVFGLGLSSLALRSGSILYGLVLHWVLAVVVPLLLARGI
jgi:membrane protease YdiL (CAAX protease family)